ncbi:hypothetical protein [Comamonas flocculans]|uniref:Glycosyltransferase RgtA/B/C/D-like domain-containing protein n=1 Tax=Comamonas flocculans TaxID=2597701 RepID=A0A5B8RS81_9BURK|nr:hypothetical protein [Comamonas flocculans]QEA12341.1 hypothetical protein FOZ74_04425 [Comamonas flocculans]
MMPSSLPRQGGAERLRIIRIYLCTTLILLLAYGIWYAGVWPGPLGQDGYSLIANINQSAPRYTGKDPAWLLYALATYGLSQRVEVLVLPLLLLQVAALARIIGWIYVRRYPITATALLLLVACTPHVLNYGSSLYPDAVFSLAFVALLFEIWLILGHRRLSTWSIAWLAILFPAACYFKANGIIILLPMLYLAIRLKTTSRWVIVAIVLSWSAAIQWGGTVANLGHGHGALRPLILFETTNFMQTRPMNLWETRHMVTDRTKEIMHRYISQEDIDSLYDRDYWDTLWHLNQDRVRFREMSRIDFRHLRSDFFTYNLWRNIPAFTASRINIFLASALAQGGMVGPDNARHGLAGVTTLSTYNPFNLSSLPNTLNEIYETSYNWRFVLWSPFVGIILVLLVFKRALQERHLDELVISSTLLLQLGGIFLFSIAAEYRYLLAFFYAPLLLFPIRFIQQNRDPLPCQKCPRSRSTRQPVTSTP